MPARCPQLCPRVPEAYHQRLLWLTVGAHVSMGGGIERAVVNAASIGACPASMLRPQHAPHCILHRATLLQTQLVLSGFSAMLQHQQSSSVQVSLPPPSSHHWLLHTAPRILLGSRAQAEPDLPRPPQVPGHSRWTLAASGSGKASPWRQKMRPPSSRPARPSASTPATSCPTAATSSIWAAPTLSWPPRATQPSWTACPG